VLSLKAIIPRISGLQSFNYSDLEETGVVGRRSFGVVSKVNHRSPVNDLYGGLSFRDTQGSEFFGVLGLRDTH